MESSHCEPRERSLWRSAAQTANQTANRTANQTTNRLAIDGAGSTETILLNRMAIMDPDLGPERVSHASGIAQARRLMSEFRCPSRDEQKDAVRRCAFWPSNSIKMFERASFNGMVQLERTRRFGRIGRLSEAVLIVRRCRALSDASRILTGRRVCQ